MGPRSPAEVGEEELRETLGGRGWGGTCQHCPRCLSNRQWKRVRSLAVRKSLVECLGGGGGGAVVCL